MIFSGHENPFIIFERQEKIHTNQKNLQIHRKIAEIMKKKGFWQVSFLVVLYKQCFWFHKILVHNVRCILKKRNMIAENQNI